MESLRIALRRLAKAVVIITTANATERFAMAATAVSELSFDPPSMLICVNRTATIYPVLASGAPFAVNILSRTHLGVALRCSGATKGEARFALGDWERAALEVPRLTGAQATIVCHNVKRIDHGSHGIFIGDVCEVFIHGDVEPLVYVDGLFTHAVIPDARSTG